MIREKVSGDLRDAIKAQDARRVGTLRLICAALKDREVAAGTDDSAEGVTDAEIRALLARMVRQRQDSAKSYEEGGRLDLADQERAEAAIIGEYLPRQMSEAEMRQAVADAIEETGASSVRDMGKVMGCLKSRHAGEMDFNRACTAVKQTFR